MKVDKYTKITLTVIAVCLVTITLNQIDFIPRAHAADTLTNSSITGNYGLVPINEDGSINVNIKSSSGAMDVNIEDVDTYAFTYCTVPVKVED